MNMFARSKPIRAMPLQVQGPKLPRNFAERVLDLETQLTSNLSTDLISSLMQLYSSAIEYYESQHDRKYLHYKDRLQSLLSRKDVLSVLNASQNKPPEPQKKIEENKGKNPISRPFSQTLTIHKKNPEELISGHLHESSHTSSRIKESIRDQEGDNLEKRLQARKRASSLKPSKEIAHTENSKSVKKIELYQNDIEQIMEKYAEEKLAKTYVIKKKYKDQDNEFKAMQGDKELFKKLREELEKNMLKEIDDMQIELQRERREKISELRRRYEA